MRIEIRNQPPGEPWPSGSAWETPTPENLRAICADLTPQEIMAIIRESGPKQRAAHVIADHIEALLLERGEDVLIVKREVVKLRPIGKGLAFDTKESAALRAAGDDHSADVLALQYVCPDLGHDGAEAVLKSLAGKPHDAKTTLDAIKAHFAAMGPVEFMTLPPEAV